MKKATSILGYLLVFLISAGLGVASNYVFPHGPFYRDPLAVAWSDEVGTITTDIAYGDSALTTFDLALPADKSRDAYGLVLSIHGGGYMNGDKSGDVNYIKYFAAKGYVSAAINYNLNADGHYISITDITAEVKSSVPAIVEAAAQRGYTIDRMALIGGSAGAHLSMTYAYRDGETSPVPVVFVVSMAGPTSFEPDAWYGFGQIVNVRSQVEPEGEVVDRPTVDYGDAEKATAGAEWVARLTGQQVTPQMMADGSYQDVLAPISPYALITSQSVPTILAYASADTVLPTSMEPYLLTALERNGVTHDRIVFPRSGHALQNDPDAWQQLFAKVDTYLDTYMPLSE